MSKISESKKSRKEDVWKMLVIVGTTEDGEVIMEEATLPPEANEIYHRILAEGDDDSKSRWVHMCNKVARKVREMYKEKHNE